MANRDKYTSKKLSPMQKRFVMEYDGNGKEAANRAGYKAPSAAASELLTVPKIQKAIAAKTKGVSKKRIMTLVQRQERLTEIAEGIDNKVAIKAIDVLCKIDSSYLQKIEITNYDGLSDEALVEKTIDETLKNPEWLALLFEKLKAAGYVITERE